MLKQRIITAVILAPLAIAAIFYLPLKWFAALILAVLAIAAWEWGPLMGFTTTKRRAFYVLVNVIIISGLWYLIPVDKLWTLDQPNSSALIVLWAAVGWWLYSAVTTVLYPKYSGFWSRHRSVRGFFGFLTLIPTWLAFVLLRSSEYQLDTVHGAQLLMFLFLMVWGADIGAYFVGKNLGKQKLLPNVSPGKTREGFIGGVLTACVIALIVGFFKEWELANMLKGVALAALISTISVIGDLSESMFKRQAGVKDSGTILPGHGGILDRIDSLTATAPIFAICYALFAW